MIEAEKHAGGGEAMIGSRLFSTLPVLVWAVPLLGLSGTHAAALQVVYEDHLASGWGSYSWASVKFDNLAPVHSGKYSVSVTVKAGSYGALEMRSAPLDASK